PLMLAASKGNTDLVSFFLHEGADPSLTDKSGNTAASLASAKGSREVASLLRSAPPPSAGGSTGNSATAGLPREPAGAEWGRGLFGGVGRAPGGARCAR